MAKYAESLIISYLDDAASKKPAPGGGSVSALAGALGCAMAEMAANFTVGKEKFADVEDDIQESLERLLASRGKLTRLLDEDVRAYRAVTEALALPKKTEEQKKSRKMQLASALNEALHVPLNIMRQCAAVTEEAQMLAGKANPNLLTDVGVCAILSEAACRAARLNVEINLKYLDADISAGDIKEEINALCSAALSARERVMKKVSSHLES